MTLTIHLVIAWLCALAAGTSKANGAMGNSFLKSDPGKY